MKRTNGRPILIFLAGFIAACLLMIGVGMLNEAQSQQITPRITKQYEVLDGHPYAAEDGMLIKVREIGTQGPKGEVQTMYLQHRGPHDRINQELAWQADIVFYCYPEFTDDPRFALRDAGGKVYFQYFHQSRILFIMDDAKNK